MKCRVIVVVSSVLLLISGVGIGLALDSSFITSDNVVNSSSDYCTISTDSFGVRINGSDVSFIHSSDIDGLCTITYSHASASQKGIINMGVTIRDSDTSLSPIVISMTSGGSVIGSTTLSVTGDVLSGTISGIGPLSNNENLTFSLTLSPDVSFSSNATMDLNFVAYPLPEGI